MIQCRVLPTVVFLTLLVSTASLALENVAENSVRYVSLFDADYQLTFQYERGEISSTSGDLRFPMNLCGVGEDFFCVESDLYNFSFPRTELPPSKRSWAFKGIDYKILSERNGVYVIGYSAGAGQQYSEDEYRNALTLSLKKLQIEKDELVKEGENSEEAMRYVDHLDRLIERYKCDIGGEYIESYIYYSFSYEKGVETIFSMPRLYQGECASLNSQPPIALRLVGGEGLLKSR